MGATGLLRGGECSGSRVLVQSMSGSGLIESLPGSGLLSLSGVGSITESIVVRSLIIHRDSENNTVKSMTIMLLPYTEKLSSSDMMLFSQTLSYKCSRISVILLIKIIIFTITTKKNAKKKSASL